MTKASPNSFIQSIITKPHRISWIMGVTAATFILSFAIWVPSAIRQAQQEELATLGLQISQTANIERSLNRALDLPHIMSASLLENDGSVVNKSHRSHVSSSKTLTRIDVPFTDSKGHKKGSVQFEVDWTKSTIMQTITKRIWLYALAIFILGFILSRILAKYNFQIMPELERALSDIKLGELDNPIPKPPSAEWAPLVDSFNDMLEGLKERDRMRHSLGRIMDPKIAEILIKENPKLGGRRRQATILFCDIRNYTSICEELDVDELQSFLNDYWEGTVEIIMEQEGTVDKFHGDGVCVIFGAPTLHPDDPLRAVRTAWRLVKNVERLNKKRIEQRKPPIQIGVGIHNGEVIAGNIGSERRMDYTVVGDVVNVAARIEELNKKYGTTILISDSVYEKVETHTMVKTLSLAHLRGHKKPILIHAVREFLDLEDRIPRRKAA